MTSSITSSSPVTLLGLASIVAGSFCTTAAASDFDFGLPRPSGQACLIYESYPADLDGDGDIDLAIASPGTPSTLCIMLNRGDGLMLAGPTYPLPDWGQTLDGGDVNNDGHMDLVVVSSYFSTYLTVFFGDSQGGFTSNGDVLLPVGSPGDSRLGDINGDGALDLTISWWGEGLSLMLGDGQGSFTNTLTETLGGNWFGMDLADLNGDGLPDPVITRSSPGEVYVYLADGSGGVDAPTPYQMGSGCWDVDAKDMDGDGDLDLVSTNRNVYNIAVRFNDGTGAFGPRTQYPLLNAGGFPYSSEVFDFDGDGDLDVVSVRGTGKATLFSNDGMGALTADSQANSPALGFYTELAVADFDGDATPDAMMMTSAGELHTSFNSTVQQTPFHLITNHLVAGGVAELELVNGSPGASCLLLGSLSGVGSGMYIPFFDVSTSLVNPRRASTLTTIDTEGSAQFQFSIAPSLQGNSLWLQALQFQTASNVIVTQVN